jgi:hypothetical protein
LQGFLFYRSIRLQPSFNFSHGGAPHEGDKDEAGKFMVGSNCRYAIGQLRRPTHFSM